MFPESQRPPVALNRRHQTLIKEASCLQWMPLALLQSGPWSTDQTAWQG
jgi:hypothetical protein